MLKTIIFTILLSCCSWAKTVKVAILDTGLNPRLSSQAKLCDDWKHDFTETSIEDSHGHGTNIAGIITKNAPKNFDYCLSIYKYYNNGFERNELIVARWKKALTQILKDKPDIVNISGGGTNYDPEEAKLIKAMLDAGIIVVAAAGNERSNLDIEKYYPATEDKRIVVVGNGTERYPASSSNFGKRYVDVWVDAKNLDGFGIVMSGTSQAAAVVTGKILTQKANCEIGYHAWMAK